MAYVLISLMRAFDTKRLVDVEVDVLYQVVGIAALTVECLALSFDVPFATVGAVLLSVCFMVFTVTRYRSIVMALLGSLRGGR